MTPAASTGSGRPRAARAWKAARWVSRWESLARTAEIRTASGSGADARAWVSSRSAATAASRALRLLAEFATTRAQSFSAWRSRVRAVRRSRPWAMTLRATPEPTGLPTGACSITRIPGPWGERRCRTRAPSGASAADSRASMACPEAAGSSPPPTSARSTPSSSSASAHPPRGAVSGAWTGVTTGASSGVTSSMTSWRPRPRSAATCAATADAAPADAGSSAGASTSDPGVSPAPVSSRHAGSTDAPPVVSTSTGTSTFTTAACPASGARLLRRGAPMGQSAITARMGACTSSANGWGSVTVR